MKYYALCRLAALTAVAAAIPAPLVAQTSPAALNQLRQHMRAATTMTANFIQTGAGGTARGQFSLKRPGKLRLQEETGRKLVVADGSRVSIGPAGQEQTVSLRDSPLSVLVNAEVDFGRLARVIVNNDSTLMIEIRDPLRPQFGRAAFAFAKMRSAPGGLSLQGWNAHDAQNKMTQVRLTGQRYNVGVADHLFRREE